LSSCAPSSHRAADNRRIDKRQRLLAGPPAWSIYPSHNRLEHG
jgi:hypothetical protein